MAGYILYSSPDEEKNKEVKTLEEQIKEEEDGLREEYRKLGEAYFEQNELELEVPAEFSELFDTIRARKSTLEQYKERIMSLKKIKICPYCESEIPEESVFCIMCGKKVQETKPQKLENTVTCKYCGTVLPAGSKFCGYCSHSLSDDTDFLDTMVENTGNEQKPKEKVQLKKKLESAWDESFEDDSFKEDSFEEDSFKDETSANSTGIENGYDDEYDTENDDTDDERDDIDDIVDDTDEAIDDEEDDLYATTAANTEWNAIKICPRCNKKLDRSSKFCTGCGMRLSD